MDGYIGKTVLILVEKNENGYAHGHTDTFLTAYVRSNAQPGSYILCKVAAYDGDNLIGEEA